MRLFSLLILAIPASSLPLSEDAPQVPMGIFPATVISSPKSGAPAQAATFDQLKQFLFPSRPIELPLKHDTPSIIDKPETAKEDDVTPVLEASEWARRWKDRHNTGRRLGQALAEESECFCAGGSICCRNASAEDGIDCAMGPCGLL